MTNAIGEIITQGELRALVQRAEQAEHERDEARAQAAALSAVVEAAKLFDVNRTMPIGGSERHRKLYDALDALAALDAAQKGSE